MHGRRRDEYKARLEDPKMVSAMAHKAQQWNALSQQLMVSMDADDSKEKDALFKLTEKLLLVNPDPLHLWNKRRKLLPPDFNIEPELVLTASCLERNPKAYGPWFHRKWCLAQQEQERTLLEKELDLCSQLLQLDERNFHCWNYRRFVVGMLMGHGDGSWSDDSLFGAQIVTTAACMDTTKSQDLIQAEWDFTSVKIQTNFSNYSAFHYRSKLLPLMLGNDKNIIGEELELVHNAIFTEPDDQTAWWYHRFLVVNYCSSAEILQQERDLLVELTLEEGDSKWAWMGLHVVLTQLFAQSKEEDIRMQLQECLDNLMRLDPDRAVRYASMKLKS